MHLALLQMPSGYNIMKSQTTIHVIIFSIWLKRNGVMCILRPSQACNANGEQSCCSDPVLPELQVHLPVPLSIQPEGTWFLSYLCCGIAFLSPIYQLVN